MNRPKSLGQVGPLVWPHNVVHWYNLITWRMVSPFVCDSSFFHSGYSWTNLFVLVGQVNVLPVFVWKQTPYTLSNKQITRTELTYINGNMGERFQNLNKNFVCSFFNCKASFSKSWKLEAHLCKHTGLVCGVSLNLFSILNFVIPSYVEFDWFYLFARLLWLFLLVFLWKLWLPCSLVI